MGPIVVVPDPYRHGHEVIDVPICGRRLPRSGHPSPPTSQICTHVTNEWLRTWFLQGTLARLGAQRSSVAGTKV